MLNKCLIAAGLLLSMIVPTSLRADEVVTIMPVGDSITQGGSSFRCYREFLIPVLDQRQADRSAKNATGQIDATTLRHKVLCGYQGWFRCPGDGTNEGWLHWSRRRNVTADSLTVEMWPDLSEFGEREKYVVPEFTTPDNQPACLFSSADASTVDRHFQWMQQYGIDGVFLQRFLVNLEKPSFDTVLSHVRTAAQKSGRTYAICYDLSGTPKERLYDSLVNDWKRLVDDEHVTRDDRYLHHNGKPVLFVWGFFDDRFDAATAHRIIDFFQTDSQYAVTLIGGCQWYWRREADAEWARAFRRLDVISPWNIGNYTTIKEKKVAATDSWQGDLEEARKSGKELLPVIYPGFGWTNLKGRDAGKQTIPRRGGEFFWEQFVRASDLGIDMDWVYFRYLPPKGQISAVRSEGKRSFIAGPTVSGNVPGNWKNAVDVGVDGILTDYPFELAAMLRNDQ